MSNRSLLTKLLHATLLLAVAHQLLLVGLVERPRLAAAGNAFFAWHQAVGLITLGVVTAFWLWTLLRRSETASDALLPWLSAGRRQAVWHDLRVHFDALWRFRMEHADESPLASAMHGLDLLAVSAMAVRGAVIALGRISGRVRVGESQALGPPCVGRFDRSRERRPGASSAGPPCTPTHVPAGAGVTASATPAAA